MNDDALYGSAIPVVSFFLLGTLFGLMERVSPSRPIRWRLTFAMDVLGLAVVWASVPAVTELTMLALAPYSGARLSGFGSEPVRALLYFVASDVARYATHSMMHTPMLWAAHRFHHSPKQLYWFSGNRATPVHVALFIVPQVFFGWLFAIRPEYVCGNIVLGQVMNNMMHTTWNIPAVWQRRLEWVITTPRYHAIHHASGQALRDKNFASVFTVWDRIFGNYVDPDSVDPEKLEFGTDDGSVPRYRMVLGV